eukprot:jgi/Mesvir1/22232/Mv13045-RA.1
MATYVESSCGLTGIPAWLSRPSDAQLKRSQFKHGGCGQLNIFLAKGLRGTRIFHPPSIPCRRPYTRVHAQLGPSNIAKNREELPWLPKVDEEAYHGTTTTVAKPYRTDWAKLWPRFLEVASPYWDGEDKNEARVRLAVVFAMTLATTGISVGFNFLGRDYYNALSSKDVEGFWHQLWLYLGAFAGGIPVFVMRDYLRQKLALRWRSWMTTYLLSKYFDDRKFYDIQSQTLVDNPDQRIVDDINLFTGTALSFSLTLFNAIVDLISFSGILYGIYPPLFAVLVVYSIGGTALAVRLGKGLVSLNFVQEKREADFRYSLVRVRENAESIAFYNGESSEMSVLLARFRRSFDNYCDLMIATRNLDFFTSGYRYMIQLLPAAVVAPLYFQGKVEFGVINQSFSAFNHILNDFSLVVYQFDAIAGFSAVTDRLGEFVDVIEGGKNAATAAKSSDSATATNASSKQGSPDAQQGATAAITPGDTIELSDRPTSGTGGGNADGAAKSAVIGKGQSAVAEASGKRSLLLDVRRLSLCTPDYRVPLVRDLSFSVFERDSVLIMGPSGSGKTSLMRAIAGLWRAGQGNVERFVSPPSPMTIAEANATTSINTPTSTNHTTGIIDGSTLGGNTNSNNNGGNDHLSSQQQPGSASPSSQDAPPPASLDAPESLEVAAASGSSIFFLPQKPYMVLGSLRDNLLYPTWVTKQASGGHLMSNHSRGMLPPTDAELVAVLRRVRLSGVLDRARLAGPSLASPPASGDVAAANGDVAAANGSNMARAASGAAEDVRDASMDGMWDALAATGGGVTPVGSSGARDSGAGIEDSGVSRKEAGSSSSPSSSSSTSLSSSSSGDGIAGQRNSGDDGAVAVAALSTVAEWSSVLSLGEQQRLAFARLLLARPTLALMDECTSALDADNEAHLYSELTHSGITYVSIGHRPSLMKYHNRILRLHGGDKREWSMESTEAYV